MNPRPAIHAQVDSGKHWLCTRQDVDSSCAVPWLLCRQVFMGFVHVPNSHVRAAQAPAFNFPDVSRRRFCAEHKLPGMVNLRRAGKRSRADAGAPPQPAQVTHSLSQHHSLVAVLSIAAPQHSLQRSARA